MKRKKRVLLMLGYYVRAIHHGVAAYAHEAGWELDDTMACLGRIPLDWSGDGIISCCGNRTDIIDTVLKSRLPAVDISNCEELPDVPRVLLDNHAIGRMAGEYLISQGFRDIGYFYCDPKVANFANESERSAGLREAVAAAARTFHEVHACESAEEFPRLPKPVALMAQNDEIARRLISMLLESGLQVPRDVAVLGVDTDDILREFSPVAQSFVDSNIEFQGYSAARILDELLDGSPPPSAPVMICPIRVVERASTSMLVCEHPAIHKALEFIRNHLPDDIDVGDIASHVGLSRQQLNEHFNRQFGESVGRYVLCVRISRARQLLAESDMKIQGVAVDLGFRSAAYFATVFQKETGLTPGEFRRRASLRIGGPSRQPCDES